MDFNGSSLANWWTLEDVEWQGIELHEGMPCIFYKADGQDDEIGYLHTAATIWWDAKTEQFRIDMRTVDFQFTPGSDPSVLDGLYGE